MDTCGAVDVVDDTTYLCTLAAGHPPNEDGTTITHRWVGREMDPDNPPFSREASHEWTSPTSDAG